jgi:hypothetical protein
MQVGTKQAERCDMIPFGKKGKHIRISGTAVCPMATMLR